MSMDDLASKTGMTKAAIYEIEGGKRSPLTWTISILARALGCPAGWLAFGG
jgi:transcriptional regulator with XRE-family HTH domain